MKKQGWAAIWRRKQYVIAGAFVALAVIGTTAMYSRQEEKTREQMESRLAEEISLEEQETDLAEEKQSDASEDLASESTAQGTGEQEIETAQTSALPTDKLDDTVPLADETAEIASADGETQEDGEMPDETAAGGENGTDTAEAGESADATAVSATQSTLHFAPEDGMIWPLEGNVILNYSMDSTVYFATLDQYKYNPAVIIAGEVNDKVYSVAKGQITSITNSEETGCTVTVDLGDGYQAIYGQLKELNFSEGDYVEAGHVLGYVSEPTKYYAVEGSNLYFELQKDGTPVDPVEFFE